MERRVDPRPILLLSLGHLVADLYQGAIPALLPLWKQAFALAYSATGVMMLALQLSSSVVQPVFGVFGDRFRHRYLLPAAALLAAAGVAGAVLARTYQGALVGIVLGGLGVALYHPEASRRAHEKSGELRATAMSWFSVGGNLGMGLGPLVVAALSAWGTGPLAAGLSAIGLAAALALAAGRPMFEDRPGPDERRFAGGQRPGDAGEAPGASGVGPDRWGALALLAAVVVMRSWSHAGVQAFVPLLLTESGMPAARAQALLGVFLLAGAAGTLVGGPLADAVGRKPVLMASLALAAPLMWLVGHVSFSLLPAVLAAAGFVVVSSFSVSVVLGQELLPNRVGTASGIILGTAVGSGGVGVTLIGWLADLLGLRVALAALAMLPAVGAVLALGLPDQTRLAMRGSSVPARCGAEQPR